MRVWVTNGVHQGKCDETSQGQVQADHTVRTSPELPGDASTDVKVVPVSFSTIRPVLPPHSYKCNIASHDNSASTEMRDWQLANAEVITTTTNNPPSYRKGTSVAVIEGAYKGSEGVVQGKACAGNTVLEGQYRVLLKSPKDMNIFLPGDYLQPLLCPQNQIIGLLAHAYIPVPTPPYSTAPSVQTPHCQEEKARPEDCTNPSTATDTTGTGTGTGTGADRQDVTCMSTKTLSDNTNTVEQAMGLQCAIFVDTGDLISLFALFR